MCSRAYLAYHPISATPRVGYNIYFMCVDTMIKNERKRNGARCNGPDRDRQRV